MQYSIVSGNEDGKFIIETTSVDGNSVGVISVAGGLDREKTEFYTMKVRRLLEKTIFTNNLYLVPFNRSVLVVIYFALCYLF